MQLASARIIHLVEPTVSPDGDPMGPGWYVFAEVGDDIFCSGPYSSEERAVQSWVLFVITNQGEDNEDSQQTRH